MADDTALKAEVAATQAGETAAATALADLANQVAALVASNADNIPQADLDALTQSLADARTALASAVSTDDPAPAPAPTPAPDATS